MPVKQFHHGTLQGTRIHFRASPPHGDFGNSLAREQEGNEAARSRECVRSRLRNRNGGENRGLELLEARAGQLTALVLECVLTRRPYSPTKPFLQTRRSLPMNGPLPASSAANTFLLLKVRSSKTIVRRILTMNGHRFEPIPRPRKSA